MSKPERMNTKGVRQKYSLRKCYRNHNYNLVHVSTVATSIIDFNGALAYTLPYFVRSKKASLSWRNRPRLVVPRPAPLKEGMHVLCGSQHVATSLCYQLLPFLMDYKLGSYRTSVPLVDRSVVLVVSHLVSLMVRTNLNSRGVYLS